MQPASLAETIPFYVPGPISSRVVAVVLLSQQKLEKGEEKEEQRVQQLHPLWDAEGRGGPSCVGLP